MPLCRLNTRLLGQILIHQLLWLVKQKGNTLTIENPPSAWILICVKKENHKPYSDQLQWYAQSKYFYYKEKNNSAAHKSTHDGDKLTFF